ncbi:hypothetical protein CWI38_2346p0010 [Hamiltosporidium tvaerminnensis]|uniref:Uncharacterized protein n=1 Tax=Hamiltosporidium tvaerminnensis TaxID=1176355 RepID=A0A4Q9LI43_9MICR|nr:hypothetical protein CWI38_2346p0010 [Hamiltosporidium tvaerminnensis]
MILFIVLLIQEHAYSPEGFKNDTKTIYFQCNSYQSQEIRQNRSFPQSLKSKIKKLRENENCLCDCKPKTRSSHFNTVNRKKQNAQPDSKDF